MRLKHSFAKAAAVMMAIPALFASCATSAGKLSPQLDRELSESVRMRSPKIPHASSLACLAYSFNKKFPGENLVVTKFDESSGKISERYGFFLPQRPHEMLETLLKTSGFYVSSRSESFRASLVERDGMQKGVIEPAYNQRMPAATMALEGGVTGLEFALRSDAAKAGVGPAGAEIERSQGKVSVDLQLVDMETGTILWADTASASFRSEEGGTSYQDFGVMGLDDGSVFRIGARGGKSPSLSDVLRAAMAKALYGTMAPFLQEERAICDRSVGRDNFTPAWYEEEQAILNKKGAPKAPEL